jgi:hypothetical protein
MTPTCRFRQNGAGRASVPLAFIGSRRQQVSPIKPEQNQLGVIAFDAGLGGKRGENIGPKCTCG